MAFFETKSFAGVFVSGFETTTEFVKWIRDVSDDATKIDILASLLTIGETFFFRDSKTFEGIERLIIPDLIN